MYQKERCENILAVIEENGYVTVKYLIEKLHYSKATINRDLNALEEAGKIKRSYGGAELAQTREIPIAFRYEHGKSVKKRIAKRASELVCDGDCIYVDASTTAQYMGEYLIEKKDVTVITNNMALAAFLSEYGKAVVVLGGRVAEAPYMLAGNDTVEMAARYKADKCFFATRDVTEEGEMSYTDDTYALMHKTMIRNSAQAVYLVDSDKVDRQGGRVLLGDLSLVDTVISNHKFSNDTKRKFSGVEFVEI